MAVRVPHAMLLGLSAGMAEVAAMSEFAFRKRFRSSYESSPSVSPPDLPSRKRYRGTSELVEDSEEDDDEEDEDIEESMDSDSVSEDVEDEGPTAEDEDPAAEDEGLTTEVEGPGVDDKGYGLDDESRGIDDEGHSVESDGLGLEEEEEEAVPEGQQQAAPVVEKRDGSRYSQSTINIMAAGSKDSHQCLDQEDIHSGDHVFYEAEGRPAVQQHTAIETVLNMTLENKEHFQSEKEAIFLLLTETYYQEPKPQRSNATSSSTRQSASTRHKGKEVAKPITPKSESVSEEDSDPEQASRDKEISK
ncbi:hypothetical protein Tco_0680751 [Tanacetum coccineum]|uniref:Uncharacterized protein n=1 Tax=Tanacetum coccineum TaxID=301880 RepID=A0ABQ4XM89_9ASTR